jgi:hypothetical protein
MCVVAGHIGIIPIAGSIGGCDKLFLLTESCGPRNRWLTALGNTKEWVDYRIARLRALYTGGSVVAMDWLTTTTLIVGLVLAFITGRALRVRGIERSRSRHAPG